MDPERWKQIDDLFEAALRYQSSERNLFLDEACRGDDELRQEIESLLSQAGKNDGILANPTRSLDAPEQEVTVIGRYRPWQILNPFIRILKTLLKAVRAESGDSPPSRPPRTPGLSPAEATRTIQMSEPASDTLVGPYQLVRQIGEGGMGIVYHARQVHPIRRDVALKVIKPGMDSKEVIARFESERQALAMMDHPNIARVVDAGTTATGLPYFVMELVDGVPITRYCDEMRLTVKDRIALFITVCQAIQHAHQKGVIHRDIKPSNILVRRQENEALAKVIDFGLAKALGYRLSAESMTNVGTVVGTLDYMSPEQADVARHDVDTRGDVYSLGAVMYTLLTGATPLDHERTASTSYLEALRRIREEEPKSPSVRIRGSKELKYIAELRQTDPVGLPKLLKHELDWIVMKALEKDRARRYETVNALVRDLDRYLRGEPVEAAPPSAVYQVRKFVLRHRLAVGALAALATLVLTASALIFRESRIATRRFNEVRQLAAFVIFDMNDAITPLPGSTPVRKLLVSRALQYLDSLSRDAGKDRGLQRELGKAYLRIGDISGYPSLSNLGDTSGALQNYQRALEQLEPIFRNDPRDRESGEALADVYQHLATIYSTTLRQGKDALSAAEKVVAIYQKLAEAQSSDQIQERLAIAYSARAIAAATLGRDDQFLRDYLTATKSFEELLDKTPDNSNLQRNAALGHKYVAAAMTRLGDDSSQIEYHLHRAEELDERRVAIRPLDRTAKLDLSFDYSQDGDFQRDRMKNLDAARKSYEKVLSIRESLVLTDPTDVRLRDRLVYIQNTLCNVLTELHRPAEAVDLVSKAIEIARELYVRDASPHNRYQLASAIESLGDAESAMEHREPACKAWSQSLALYSENQRTGKALEEERQKIDWLKHALISCGK